MNAIIPFTFETHTVRSLLREGEPWFVAADVCLSLEIANPRDAVSRLDMDEISDVGIADTRSKGGATQQRNMTIISEAGIYRLVFTSRTDAAERFKRWLAHDVLPAIRKTGSYGKAAPAAHPLDDGLPLSKRINAASYIAGLAARGDDKAYEAALEWAFRRLGPKKKPEKTNVYQNEPARAVKNRASAPSREFDPVEDWWRSILMCGATRRGAHGWQDMVPASVMFEDYLAFSGKTGVNRRSEAAVFGMAIRYFVKFGRRQRTVELVDSKGVARLERTWVWLLPPLAMARRQFEEVCGPQNWPEMTDFDQKTPVIGH